MENQLKVVNKSTSVTERLAEQYGTDKSRFYNIVKATCKMEKASNEQFETFLMNAERYGLNPLMKEMWAFPDRNGGIMTMVAVDGWIKIVNNQPTFDGYETSVLLDENGKPISATCTMWRKDRNRPTTKTVYVKEWIKESSPVWKTMPIHFIEMRAYIQCARMCFNISGIYDGDVAPISINLDAKYPDAITTEPQSAADIPDESEEPTKRKRAKKQEQAPIVDGVDQSTGEVIKESGDFEINPDAAAAANEFDNIE